MPGDDSFTPRTPAQLSHRSRRVDQGQMRAANMSLILRHLREQGGRSRARLASETGLSKATMSSLIADLTARGLVREGAIERAGSVGRPGQTVSLDGRSLSGIGVEINVDYAALTAVDLTGTVIRESVIQLDTPQLPLDVVLDRVGALTRRAVDSLRDNGSSVVGVTVSPPGVIDYASGQLRFAPNLGWSSVPLVAELGKRLGNSEVEIRLENDSKLSAVAEFAAFAGTEVRDLLYLSGKVGVGAGIIAEGQLVRGWSGFSGEVGHLPLDPTDRPCACGRRGCWENLIGLTELLRLAADQDDPVHDVRLPIEDRLLELQRRAAAGDVRVRRAVSAIADDLSRGLSMLVDVLNPQVTVLGGWFAYFDDLLLDPVRAALRARRMDAGSATEVTTSRLGFRSTSLGGAHLAVERVFADPVAVTSELEVG